MCQPELKPPSVEIWAIRSRTVLVSAATVVVTAAIAALAPIAPPTTKAIRTAHFFVRSMRINPPLRVDAGILPQSVRCLPRLRGRSGTLAHATAASLGHIGVRIGERVARMLGVRRCDRVRGRLLQ